MSAILLVVRVITGAIFAAHGMRKAFGWFDGAGSNATALALEDAGYPNGRKLAGMLATTEILAGTAMIFGFMIPFASAAIIGVMFNAFAIKPWRSGLWSGRRGAEYPVVMAGAAFFVAAAGPGEWSLDAVLEMNAAGFDGALIALALGLLGGAIMLVARRPSPSILDERHRQTA